MDTSNQLVDLYDQNTINLINDLNNNNPDVDPDIADLFTDYKIDTPSLYQTGMSIVKTPNGGFN
jgi:hypothetical protein